MTETDGPARENRRRQAAKVPVRENGVKQASRGPLQAANHRHISRKSPGKNTKCTEISIRKSICIRIRNSMGLRLFRLRIIRPMIKNDT